VKELSWRACELWGGGGPLEIEAVAPADSFFLRSPKYGNGTSSGLCERYRETCLGRLENLLKNNVDRGWEERGRITGEINLHLTHKKDRFFKASAQNEAWEGGDITGARFNESLVQRETEKKGELLYESSIGVLKGLLGPMEERKCMDGKTIWYGSSTKVLTGIIGRCTPVKEFFLHTD